MRVGSFPYEYLDAHAGGLTAHRPDDRQLRDEATSHREQYIWSRYPADSYTNL